VVPNAHRETQTTLVRHLDEPIQRGQITLLLLQRQSHHPHPGEALHIEEIRVVRREKAPVLVAEDNH
jgi:hypothetical protein